MRALALLLATGAVYLEDFHAALFCPTLGEKDLLCAAPGVRPVDKRELGPTRLARRARSLGERASHAGKATMDG